MSTSKVMEIIHKIREKNFEETKHLSTDEILKRTEEKAKPLIKKLEEMKAKRKNISL